MLYMKPRVRASPTFSLNLSDGEKAIVEEVRLYHGLSSGAETLRFLLHKEQREIQAIKPQRGKA